MPQIKQLLLSFLLLFNFTTGGAQLYNPVPNDFPIIAWYSLEPNFINHREFKNLKKSGFNIALTAPLTGQETLEALIDNLADLTGKPAQTFIMGSTNLRKVSQEKKDLATAKNWSLR